MFSVHLEVDTDLTPKEYNRVKEMIHNLVEKYGISHSTVEIEFPDETCRNIDNDACNYCSLRIFSARFVSLPFASLLLTAAISALYCPMIMTSFLPRVTAV